MRENKKWVGHSVLMDTHTHTHTHTHHEFRVFRMKYTTFRKSVLWELT